MLTIGETLEAQSVAAMQKVQALRSPGRLFFSGMLAGAYLGIGVVLMVSTAGPLVATGDGAAKLVAGLVFGVALTLVAFAGGELVTSAMMVLPQGTLMKAISGWSGLITLALVFVANLIGALGFGILIVISGVLTSNAAAGSMLGDLLENKAHETNIEMFTRGVLCNMLVCLAMWMAARASGELAKIVLIFLAITAFVASGFEHVVANMATYSIGILSGNADADIALFANNLLWVGFGNLVGGLIIGIGYWYVGGRPHIGRTSL